MQMIHMFLRILKFLANGSDLDKICLNWCEYNSYIKQTIIPKNTNKNKSYANSNGTQCNLLMHTY